MGYNVQTAVDAKHHLIVTHEVTNQGHDRHQLHHMAQQAKEAIGAETLAVVADRGYFKGEEILACEKSQITTYLPKPQTSGSTKKGLFSKRDFIYHAEDNEYACPAGERLIWRFETEEKGLKIHKYWSSHCPTCSIKSQCTTSQYRRVGRWEHEAVHAYSLSSANATSSTTRKIMNTHARQGSASSGGSRRRRKD